LFRNLGNGYWANLSQAVVVDFACRIIIIATLVRMNLAWTDLAAGQKAHVSLESINHFQSLNS